MKSKSNKEEILKFVGKGGVDEKLINKIGKEINESFEKSLRKIERLNIIMGSR